MAFGGREMGCEFRLEMREVRRARGVWVVVVVGMMMRVWLYGSV